MGTIPVAKTSLNMYDDYDSLQVIPVVYLRNEVFKKCTKSSLDTLADNVNFLINKYRTGEDFKDTRFSNEYQMDCDWTLSTKDNYFYFLKKLKALSGKTISCTLRLYPYKYSKKMGVPPVDKVMLMCYNLINPLENKDKNSILDIDELKKYLDKKNSYDIHLDIALPTFYWTQLYQNNRFSKLVDLSTKEVKSFAKEVKPYWYQIEKDTSINYETYFKAGDQLKCEDVSAQDLIEAISLIKKNVDLDKNVTVSLFDLDSSTFNQYTNEEISSFYSAFTK